MCDVYALCKCASTYPNEIYQEDRYYVTRIFMLDIASPRSASNAVSILYG